jgi:hypothetical protein
MVGEVLVDFVTEDFDANLLDYDNQYNWQLKGKPYILNRSSHPFFH